MTDKAIEFLTPDNGNFIIRTLDIQEGLNMDRKAINPTNPIRTGNGSLIKQVLKYSKTDFELSGTSFNRNLRVYFKNLFDNNVDFVMKVYYKDGDIVEKGVRGDRAVSVETFFCTIVKFNSSDNINDNTFNIEVIILEL